MDVFCKVALLFRYNFYYTNIIGPLVSYNIEFYYLGNCTVNRCLYSLYIFENDSPFLHPLRILIIKYSSICIRRYVNEITY